MVKLPEVTILRYRRKGWTWRSGLERKKEEGISGEVVMGFLYGRTFQDGVSPITTGELACKVRPNIYRDCGGAGSARDGDH